MPDDAPPDERPWDRDRARRRRGEDDAEDDYDDRPRRRRRPPEEEYDDPALGMIVPLNTSALAIAAGYVGLISVLCVPAPLALLLGILALAHLKKHPKQHGKVRAIFAIVMGAVFSVALVFTLIAIAMK